MPRGLATRMTHFSDGENAARGNQCESGDDVGKKLVLKRRNAVLQDQFSLLQPLHLKVVWMRRRLQGVDGAVEIPVLLPQPGQLVPHRGVADLNHPVVVHFPLLCRPPIDAILARNGALAKRSRLMRMG
jgi:hypothetical protein